jgi:hypothetical protein
VRRRFIKSVVKDDSLTIEVPLILMNLSAHEVSGMDGVAVKCIDIVQNTDSEDSLPECN